MKYIEIIIEPDDTCFGDPWGETRCIELNNDDKCSDIENCLECKKTRIADILKTIKIKSKPVKVDIQHKSS